MTQRAASLQRFLRTAQNLRTPLSPRDTLGSVREPPVEQIIELATYKAAPLQVLARTP
jgi:hypothetical protein